MNGIQSSYESANLLNHFLPISLLTSHMPSMHCNMTTTKISKTKFQTHTHTNKNRAQKLRRDSSGTKIILHLLLKAQPDFKL